LSFEPAQLPSVTAQFFVVGILAAEVVGWLLFTSDMIRAVMVVAVLAPFCVLILVGSRFTIPAVLLRANIGVLVGAAAYFAIGAYGTMLGLVNRNEPYYLLSDLYHWYGEGMLVAALMVAMLHGMSSRHLLGLLSWAGLLLGMLVLAAEVAGTLGVDLAGGHLIRNLHVWRLEAGRGFPTVPLIFVTAIVFKGHPQGRTKLVARIAFIALLAALFVTFKRSQWLTYAFLAVAFLAPQQWQWLTRWTAAVLLGFALAIMLSIPGGIEQGKDKVLELLTYNPSYETADALEGRATQLESVAPWILKRPAGYGFGAEIYIYTPSINEGAQTHYVHNAYMYYAVQLGIPVTLLGLLLLAALLLALALRFGLDDEWDWLIYGAFASVCAVMIMNLALVCFHTPLFGFSLGAAVVAVQNVPLRRRVSNRISASKEQPLRTGRLS
jgi:hypothetical protein